MRTEHFAKSLVKQVGCRVVGRDGSSCSFVYTCSEIFSRVRREFVSEMHTDIILFFSVENLNGLAGCRRECSAIAHLSAHFSIERCF